MLQLMDGESARMRCSTFYNFVCLVLCPLWLVAGLLMTVALTPLFVIFIMGGCVLGTLAIMVKCPYCGHRIGFMILGSGRARTELWVPFAMNRCANCRRHV